MHQPPAVVPRAVTGPSDAVFSALCSRRCVGVGGCAVGVGGASWGAVGVGETRGVGLMGGGCAALALALVLALVLASR
jgi:hypothetical protein